MFDIVKNLFSRIVNGIYTLFNKVFNAVKDFFIKSEPFCPVKESELLLGCLKKNPENITKVSDHLKAIEGRLIYAEWHGINRNTLFHGLLLSITDKKLPANLDLRKAAIDEVINDFIDKHHVSLKEIMNSDTGKREIAKYIHYIIDDKIELISILVTKYSLYLSKHFQADLMVLVYADELSSNQQQEVRQSVQHNFRASTKCDTIKSVLLEMLDFINALKGRFNTKSPAPAQQSAKKFTPLHDAATTEALLDEGSKAAPHGSPSTTSCLL